MTIFVKKTIMKTTLNYNVKVINDKHGTLLNESFVEREQFKIFLKMIDGSLNLNEDLSFYDGDIFMVHIPHKILKESIVITGVNEITLSEQVRNKLETLVS